MKRIWFALPLIAQAAGTFAQTHDLIGYWHNWNDASAPYIALDQIDPRYTVIEVAFAEPAPGTSYDMQFTPAQTSPAVLTAQIAALQAAGKKVLISIGGANATVHLGTDAERDQFVLSMSGIIDDYGFDGIDIDLEGSSVSISGGSIATPIDSPILRLIDAIETIGDQFLLTHGIPMMLTMAPETAYVQGGMSAFGGIWGAYLPIIDALRARIDILQVQLYNSGSMYGIDGDIYTQGNADFIVSQTEALLQGFNTAGGWFAPLPPEKVAIGLPACPMAAGGGYVPPTDITAAVEYLRFGTAQPGSYATLATYPGIRGLMTWSINWDASSACGSNYDYAATFEDLFSVSTLASDPEVTEVASIASLARAGDRLVIPSSSTIERVWLTDPVGRIVPLRMESTGVVLLPQVLATGQYVLMIDTGQRRIAHRIFVDG